MGPSALLHENTAGFETIPAVSNVNVTLAGTARLVADSAEAEAIAAAAEEEQNEDDAGAVIASSAAPVTAEAAEAIAAAATAKQQDDYDQPTAIIVTASAEESTHFISSFLLAVLPKYNSIIRSAAERCA